MGLSASQARLLNLTARMHDIEYKAQNLEAQKLQMANESAHVYQEYEDALNKQKLQYRKLQNDGSFNFEDATFAKLQAAGYYFRVMQANGTWSDIKTTASAACTAAGVTDSTKTISNMVEAGFVIFIKKDDQNVELNVATDTGLQQVSDEIDLKKAEAKYEADMRKINQKDKKFDTDLAALEAERNAIKTEMDTLKSVAKDNVDRTYKLFS